MRPAAPSASQFGNRYMPEKPRFYSTKAKNAQEAHEAIRPTDFNRTPDQVRNFLDADQLRLYDLIWKRGIASQMASAEIERTTAEITADNNGQKAGLRAVGSVIRFDGFIAAYTDPRKTASRATMATRMAACRRSMRAKTSPSRRSIRPSISPSRRRVIRKQR